MYIHIYTSVSNVFLVLSQHTLGFSDSACTAAGRQDASVVQPVWSWKSFSWLIKGSDPLWLHGVLRHANVYLNAPKERRCLQIPGSCDQDQCESYTIVHFLCVAYILNGEDDQGHIYTGGCLKDRHAARVSKKEPPPDI